MGLYLLQHMFYILHTDTFPSWRRGPWTSVKRGVWSLYVPQSPVSWIVTGTCTHLKERGYLLLRFHDYLLSCIFAAIWQILRGRSHRLQSNQLKTRKNFLASAGNWTQDLSVLSLLPCHLSHHTSTEFKNSLFQVLKEYIVKYFKR